jgi:3-dehydroquinate synthetase
MAEIVKHALIQRSTPLGGADLREALETLQLDPLPADEHECVLTRNVAIKHSVVQADERESGLRMVLNFGHTVGHAIEAEGYRYRHGQAVAIGMLVAARIALRLGRVDVTYVNRVSALLERARLPVTMEGRVSDILARIHRDKKNVDGALHWILPERNGLVEPVTGVPVEIVRQALIESGAA